MGIGYLFVGAAIVIPQNQPELIYTFPHSLSVSYTNM